ncbi:MAG: transcriptional repressor [Treponema sp.]|nr:transcriptional repressor [Treponema sp.]
MNINFPFIFQEAGIRPSIQRIAVYKYLYQNPVHPDVETVYSDLASDYPTLSKTTVYNTLKLFEEKNIVQSLKIEDDKLRFDAEMKSHIHFKCTKCGKITDIFTPENSPDPVKLYRSFLPDGFSMTKQQSTIWGLCKDCN